MCTHVHTLKFLQTHGSPCGPARHTQTGQHTHVPSPSTDTQTHSPGTLSGFTVSTTENMSVSTLWIRGREKKRWKWMCLLAREKRKIKQAVSLSTSHYHPGPGLSQTRARQNPSCPVLLSPYSRPLQWQAWGFPCRKVGAQMNWAHL